MCFGGLTALLHLAVLACMAVPSAAGKSKRKKVESDSGVRLAKMLDTNKDGELVKPEMRKAPADVLNELGFDQFTIVGALQKMDTSPRDAVYTLKEAAAYFNKVLEAKASGIPLGTPLEDKPDEDEDTEEDEVTDAGGDVPSRTYELKKAATDAVVHLMRRLDTNSNERLTEVEMKPLLEALVKHIDRTASKLFKEIDKNGDRQVHPDELKIYCTVLFEGRPGWMVDFLPSDFFTAPAPKAPTKPKPTPEPVSVDDALASLVDPDGDGVVTLKELEAFQTKTSQMKGAKTFQTSPEKTHMLMDTNRDGTVRVEEVQAMIAKMAKGMAGKAAAASPSHEDYDVPEHDEL